MVNSLVWDAGPLWGGSRELVGRLLEVNSLLDVMVQASHKIKNQLGSCQFLLPVADSIDPNLVRQRLGAAQTGIDSSRFHVVIRVKGSRVFVRFEAVLL